jgi:hypothetical protein
MGKDNSIWEKRKRKAALTLECPPVVGHLPCLWQDSMSKLSSKQECLFSQQTRMSAVQVQRTLLCFTFDVGMSFFHRTIPSQNDIADLFDWKRTG